MVLSKKPIQLKFCYKHEKDTTVMPIIFTKAFSKTTIVIYKYNLMFLLHVAIWGNKYLYGFQLTWHLYLHQKQHFP